MDTAMNIVQIKAAAFEAAQDAARGYSADQVPHMLFGMQILIERLEQLLCPAEGGDRDE